MNRIAFSPEPVHCKFPMVYVIFPVGVGKLILCMGSANSLVGFLTSMIPWDKVPLALGRLSHVQSCFWDEAGLQTVHMGEKYLLKIRFQWKLGKSILQVPDTSTWVLDNIGIFLRSSIASFWVTPARFKECKYHFFRQYRYTRYVPVFTNTGTFQYLGPEVCFLQNLKLKFVE